MPFGTEKLEWCGYSMEKKFEDMFIRFYRMYERDRQTNRHCMMAKNHVFNVSAILIHDTPQKVVVLEWRALIIALH